MEPNPLECLSPYHSPICNSLKKFTYPKPSHTSKSENFIQSIENPEELLYDYRSATIHQKLNLNTIDQFYDSYYESLTENMSIPGICLRNHAVSPFLRSHMINWMIEVFDSFTCDDQTFFLAVSIMDNYYANHAGIQNPEDIHLTGITCMFIASKLTEEHCLCMEMVYKSIAHEAYSCEEIIHKEQDIVKTLDFEPVKSTVYDFIEFETAFLDKILYDPIKTQKFREAAIIIGRMACYEYRFLTFSPSDLSCYIIASLLLKEAESGTYENRKIAGEWLEKMATENNERLEDLKKGANIILEFVKKFAEKYGPDNNVFIKCSRKINNQVIH